MVRKPVPVRDRVVTRVRGRMNQSMQNAEAGNNSEQLQMNPQTTPVVADPVANPAAYIASSSIPPPHADDRMGRLENNFSLMTAQMQQLMSFLVDAQIVPPASTRRCSCCCHPDSRNPPPHYPLSQYFQAPPRGQTPPTTVQGQNQQLRPQYQAPPQQQEQGQARPPRNLPRVFTKLPVSLAEVFRGALHAGEVKTEAFRPRTVVTHPDPTAFCEFHTVQGHDTNNCARLKHVIQNLIDEKRITINGAPNVQNNPLPTHQQVPHNTINMIWEDEGSLGRGFVRREEEFELMRRGGRVVRTPKAREPEVMAFDP